MFSRSSTFGRCAAILAVAALMPVTVADAASRDKRFFQSVAGVWKGPGEIVAGGGRVLDLVDLSDVYLTFFLPETVAGRVALGSEVRIVLDAAPEFVLPAKVSFVASQAQFTPKTVETASERQKLMFKVRAHIDPQLLARYSSQVKTGMPGMAYVRIQPDEPWPDQLAVNLPAEPAADAGSAP